jgi:transposase
MDQEGRRFKVLSNTGRYHLNINGAIDIESMQMVTRSYQRVNADSICELLKSLRAKHLSGEVIHLILDNARYNRSWKVKELACDPGIALIYLIDGKFEVLGTWSEGTN